ncbi:MAG: hypothetical protein ACKO43_00825 [Alphaproteobacteria bacterium]
MNVLGATHKILVHYAIAVAALANPVLRRVNPNLDIKTSPMTAMGVYAFSGDIFLLLSGVMNQNPYRILQALLSTPNSLVYVVGGMHSDASIPINSMGDILSCVEPEKDFSDVSWPEGLGGNNESLALTPMKCLDCVGGILALSKKGPNSEIDQTDINQAGTAFLKFLEPIAKLDRLG